MTGQPGGDTGRGAGIGARLRGARERSGLTVADAARKLHLDPEILQTLEMEDFSALGAPIYVKSYLSRYAGLLGESAEELQELLSSAVVIPEPDLTRIPHVNAAGSRLAARSATVVIVLLAALLVVSSLWWGWSRWYKRPSVLGPSRTARHAATPHPTRPPAAVPVVRHGSAAHGGAPAAANQGPTGRIAAASSAGPVQITLRFAAPSWVAVDDASGRRLYRSLAPADSMRVLQGRAPLHVVLGYAPGVTLAVNGLLTPFAAFVQPDHTASFLITADGRVRSGPRAGGE